MKKIVLSFLIMVCIIGSAYRCESPSQNDIERASTCGIPNWLDTIIASTKQNGNKGKVIQYQYNGETVFLIDTCIDCADGMAVVYNCSGETRCQFGGIAGFNTCPDFDDTATDKKIIWSN